MKAIDLLPVRCKLDASSVTVRNHVVRCFFSSGDDLAGAAKRNVNWLLLTLVVWHRSPIGVWGLLFSQFRSSATRATSASALLAERVIKQGKGPGDWFFAAAIGGASSRTAKVFVPPIPRLFSPARRGVSVTGKSCSFVFT